jgi:4-amino-4-deoxy-L-arabinose transferase-like glycosyltransferase
MFAFLPLVAFVVAAMYFHHTNSLRKSVLLAALFVGTILAVSTELLSLINKINYLSVTVFWAVVDAAVIGYCLNCRKFRLKPHWHVSPLNYAFVTAVFLIFSLTLLIAFIVPPNNWDSMTYHMPRVMHWIQNRSVAHYPTNITRQLYFAPWAEFAIMHLQVLSGGDRFANLVQWSAMVGSVIGVSLIAQEIGATLRTQVLAAVLAATIPMGILQASTTQNDYAVSLWLVCFVYFGLLYRKNPDVITALALGCSLGLAILTKGSAYLFAFPFVVWFAYSGVRNLRFKFVVQAIVVLLAVVGLNSGHWSRNYNLWGNPLYVDTDNNLTNGKLGLSVMVSNVIRNAALHVETPLEGVNSSLNSAISYLHEVIHLDVNDRATTMDSFKVGGNNRSEDSAGDTLHFFLKTAALAILILSYRKIPRDVVLFAGALICSFLLYCFCLKWNSYGSRVQLTLFLLWSPIIASAVESIKKPLLAVALGVILLINSVPYLVFASYRPLIGNSGQQSVLDKDRSSQYFSRRPALREYYLNNVRSLKASGCRDVGLLIGMDSWEYPFWALYGIQGGDMPRIEHVEVRNKSAGIDSFVPCGVFVTYDR